MVVELKGFGKVSVNEKDSGKSFEFSWIIPSSATIILTGSSLFDSHKILSNRMVAEYSASNKSPELNWTDNS